MREILFRGKIKDYGKWVEGNLFVDEKGEKYSISIRCWNYRAYWEVIPETVGQFTGLYDRTKWEELSTEEQGTFLYPENGGKRTKEEWKGRPIFEGDIVLFEDESPANYEYHDCTEMRCGAIEYGDNCFFITNRIAVEMEDLIYYYGKLDVKIIGNIHDNPELLEGENNA